MQAGSHVPAEAYSTNQLSCDLRRLRLRGLVVRVAGSHTYLPPSYSRRTASLTPSCVSAQRRCKCNHAARTHFQPDRPNHAIVSVPPLVTAFREINLEFERLVANAHLAPAGNRPSRWG